ncbi:MAG: dephospho-CoA kinase [Clostridiales bacterium]|nr:dephospho-CoA kinase [Clostridiales bacterium]
MKVGLTGSSGSGKSTVAAMFANAGFYIIDCDKISKSIDTDEKYVSLLRQNFGDAAFDKSGNVDRRALGNIVFGDAEKLKLLSSISHPIITKIIEKKLDEHVLDNVIIDAPLLFESGADGFCDVTVGVVADEQTRAARVAKRDFLDDSSAKIRVSSQQNADFYKNNCTYVIENNGSVTDLEKSFEALLGKLMSGRK